MTCYFLAVVMIAALFSSTLSLPITSPERVTVEQTQSIKAITCLYIVIGHIGKVLEQPGWFRILSSFAWIDVGVFFFISGYGLAYGYHRKPDYLKTFPKRLCSVAIPFFVAHVVYMVGNTLFGIHFSLEDVIKSLLGNSTLVRNDWYVPACLLFYLCF